MENKYSMSPIASPRSKLTRASISEKTEYNVYSDFVKGNIKLLLRLVTNDIHMVDQVTLNSSELDSMRILLFNENNENESISVMSPFYKEDNEKVASEAISEWILSNLSQSESSKLALRSLTEFRKLAIVKQSKQGCHD